MRLSALSCAKKASAMAMCIRARRTTSATSRAAARRSAV
jgi:hypothetical protein